MSPGQALMAPSSGGATLLLKKICAVPYVGLPDQSCAAQNRTSVTAARNGMVSCVYSLLAAPSAARAAQ